jgi:dTDP-glucose 4,6-dehydratase
MRILIFGAKGWIGEQFQTACTRARNGGSEIEYRASDVARISLDTQSELIDEITKYKPTHVVSFVGRTHGVIGDRVYTTIDYLEQDDKLAENLRDNLAAPLLLAYLCKYAGIHFTYLGTGCIFSYKDGEDVDRMLQYDAAAEAGSRDTIEQCYKFKESDPPNFFGSSYSIVKGYTDRIMQERNCICESVLNLRIRMPIVAQDNPRNFITKIANYPKVCSLPNSMTVLDEFLPYALVLMQHRYVGTLNFVNPGVISHNEILRMYRAHVNPDFKWTNFTVEEQNAILASKRSNNYLDNEKLLSIFPKVCNIYDAVQHCMRNYNDQDQVSNSELYLDAIDCTLRLTPDFDNGDNNNTAAAEAAATKILGRGGGSRYAAAAAAGIPRAVKTAATYAAGAAEECTRILSATVGELYTKMLANIPNSGGGSNREYVEMKSRNIVANEPDTVPPAIAVNPPLDPLTDAKDTVICVTGGAGFIGSHYINYVWNRYEHVRIINVDCLYYCANIHNVDACVREDIHGRYTFHRLNLAGGSDTVAKLLNLFRSEGVTHVVHFAAQSHVQNSFGESLQYTQDNVVGTHNLLEAARHYAALKLFVHVSTDEVYGESMLDANETHKTEQSVLCPTNPYAATKAAAELIAQSYYHSFKLPLIITRGNNVYGPNQYPEKLIPKFIKMLKDGCKLPIQGDGTNLRSFIHVSDVCRAFDTILNCGTVGEIYNIGSNIDCNEFSVLDVAKLLIKLVHGIDVSAENNSSSNSSSNSNSVSDVDWIEYVEDRPFNDKRYYISNDKLTRLGWKTQVDFVTGLTELI